MWDLGKASNGGRSADEAFKARSKLLQSPIELSYINKLEVFIVGDAAISYLEVCFECQTNHVVNTPFSRFLDTRSPIWVSAKQHKWPGGSLPVIETNSEQLVDHTSGLLKLCTLLRVKRDVVLETVVECNRVLES